VQVRTLYTKIPTYPLTGLPLVYMIASRNGAELDRITRELVRGNLYTTDPFNPEIARQRRSNDDRPMFQPGAIAGMTIVCGPFALMTLAFVLYQLKKQVGSLTRSDVWSELFLGALLAVIGIWLTARGARAFVAGPQMGFAYCCVAMCAGISGGLIAARRQAPTSSVSPALISCAFAFVVLLAFPFTALVALIGSLSGGFGMGTLVAAPRPTAAQAPQGVVLTLGILLGIYAFQFGLMWAGFRVVSLCALAIIALQGRRARRASFALGARAPLTG
jgi:hypothetical protein